MNTVFSSARIIKDRFLKFNEEKKEEVNIENVER
jgi:Na+/pantothenate symporter